MFSSSIAKMKSTRYWGVPTIRALTRPRISPACARPACRRSDRHGRFAAIPPLYVGSWATARLAPPIRKIVSSSGLTHRAADHRQIPDFLDAVAAGRIARSSAGRLITRDGVRFETFAPVLFVCVSAGLPTSSGQDEHDMVRRGASAAGWRLCVVPKGIIFR
jgi:hypothetical protein